jgi:hypothetical protein
MILTEQKATRTSSSDRFAGFSSTARITLQDALEDLTATSEIYLPSPPFSSQISVLWLPYFKLMAQPQEAGRFRLREGVEPGTDVLCICCVFPLCTRGSRAAGVCAGYRWKVMTSDCGLMNYRYLGEFSGCSYLMTLKIHCSGHIHI